MHTSSKSDEPQGCSAAVPCLPCHPVITAGRSCSVPRRLSHHGVCRRRMSVELPYYVAVGCALLAAVVWRAPARGMGFRPHKQWACNRSPVPVQKTLFACRAAAGICVELRATQARAVPVRKSRFALSCLGYNPFAWPGLPAPLPLGFRLVRPHAQPLPITCRSPAAPCCCIPLGAGARQRLCGCVMLKQLTSKSRWVCERACVRVCVCMHPGALRFRSMHCCIASVPLCGAHSHCWCRCVTAGVQQPRGGLTCRKDDTHACTLSSPDHTACCCHTINICRFVRTSPASGMGMSSTWTRHSHASSGWCVMVCDLSGWVGVTEWLGERWLMVRVADGEGGWMVEWVGEGGWMGQKGGHVSLCCMKQRLIPTCTWTPAAPPHRAGLGRAAASRGGCVPS